MELFETLHNWRQLLVVKRGWASPEETKEITEIYTIYHDKLNGNGNGERYYKEIIELSDIVKFSEDELEIFTSEYVNSLKDKLPEYKDISVSEKAPSITIQFATLSEREKACEILSANGIRYRTGKTLTPFRLSGDISWGVPCPEVDGLKNQTFYVWPESLWAPISFTMTYLNENCKEVFRWWDSDEAGIYQFMLKAVAEASYETTDDMKELAKLYAENVKAKKFILNNHISKTKT